MSKDIADRMKSENLIDKDTHDDIFYDADNGNIKDIFSSVSNKGIYSTVAEAISNWDEIEDNITSGSNFYICNVQSRNHHYFKEIGAYKNCSNFVCASAETLKGYLTNFNDESMMILERIWVTINTDQAKKDALWDLILNGGSYKYVIVTDLNVTNDEEKWRLYSYGYFLYCNSNSFERDNRLDFDENKPFESSMNVVSNFKYEQYFDIYDIIGDSHYFNDILRRYLNMYHIIENMCYRRHLAKISRGNIKKNGFVRNALSKFGNGSKNESDEIPEGITKLFPNLDSLFTNADFPEPVKKFLNNEYGISVGSSPTAKQIAKIIYQLRNSIAHNKATELHFAYSNVEDYKAIIDLIKKIINQMEPAIVHLIGHNPLSGNPHPLEYKERSFDVY